MIPKNAIPCINKSKIELFSGEFWSGSKAKELGLTPKAEIIDYSFTGQRLEDELLLGPAFAMSKALDNANLKLEDMDVFEIHEAFAGQVLANIKCLDDKVFCKERLKKDKTVGKIEMNKVNSNFLIIVVKSIALI